MDIMTDYVQEDPWCRWFFANIFQVVALTLTVIIITIFWIGKK